MTNVWSDEVLMLLGEMRSLLEEILAADTNIAAVNFRVVYLSEDQIERIRRALAAGEPFSLTSPPPA
jgi:hypothetical protein